MLIFFFKAALNIPLFRGWVLQISHPLFFLIEEAILQQQLKSVSYKIGILFFPFEIYFMVNFLLI